MAVKQIILDYIEDHDLDIPFDNVRATCREIAAECDHSASTISRTYYRILDRGDQENNGDQDRKKQPTIKKKHKGGGETLSPENGGPSPEEGNWFEIDRDDEFYLFGIDGTRFTMSFREIEDMVSVYVHEGGGLTQVQVSRHMWRRHRRKLTADFVRKIFKVLGVVKANPPLAPHIVRDEDPEEASELWHEQKLAEIETRYRAKRHKKLEKALKEERKKSLRFEDLAAEYLGEQDRKVIEVNADPLPRTDAPAHTVIVCLSDWHVGKISEQIRGGSDFRQKIDRLKGEIQRHFEWRDQRPVDRLIFAITGDMLDGTQGDMHSGQWYGQWCHGKEQADIASEALAEVIESTAALLNPKTCEAYAVTGNHDRTSQARDADPFRTVGGLTYLLAEERSAWPTWEIIDDPFGKFEAGGTGFLLAHGDETPSDPRQLFHGLGGDYQAVITGHYHSHAIEEDYRGLWFQVGSLCGVDEYARQHGIGAMPSQLVISCEQGKPPISRYIPVL